MTRKDVIKQIVTALDNADLLNENDFYSHDAVIEETTKVIMQALDDYELVYGTVVR